GGGRFRSAGDGKKKGRPKTPGSEARARRSVAEAWKMCRDRLGGDMPEVVFEPPGASAQVIVGPPGEAAPWIDPPDPRIHVGHLMHTWLGSRDPAQWRAAMKRMIHEFRHTRQPPGMPLPDAEADASAFASSYAPRLRRVRPKGTRRSRW